MKSDVPAIAIERLSKKYGETEAVRGLSLSVAPGEIFTFLGPNGAGKTTTIKVLAGLLKPTEGRTCILGHDVQKEPVEAKRLIGYIPDHPYLYEKLTGREFCQFVGDLFATDRATIDRHRDEHFRLFGLAGAEDELVENYSHGMRQKLVFTVALLHDPRVLIVDEPMVGLDPQSAQTVKQLLKTRASETNMAVFLSTHTLSVAEEVCDRVGVIDRGRLVFIGSLDEMRRQVGDKGSLEGMFLDLTDGSARGGEGA